MKTNHLKSIAALIPVARLGSLTKAADFLGCSKAYLSQQIKKLEQQYQVQLFHRTTRKITLTQAGVTFFNRCEKAMNIIEEAESNLLETQHNLCGVINVTSVGGIFGEQYVAKAIMSFMLAYPDIKVNLDFSSTHKDLVANPFDLAIRMGPLEDSTLVARQLCWYRPILIASPAYLKKMGTPMHPKELTNHRIISGSITQWRFTRNNEHSPHQREEFELKVNSQLQGANGHVMLKASEAGLGFARLPSFYVQNSIQAGSLVPVLNDWHQQQSPCHIVYPPGRFRLKRIRALVDWITEEFKQYESLR